jgi:hypothetical protein
MATGLRATNGWPEPLFNAYPFLVKAYFATARPNQKCQQDNGALAQSVDRVKTHAKWRKRDMRDRHKDACNESVPEENEELKKGI